MTDQSALAGILLHARARVHGDGRARPPDSQMLRDLGRVDARFVPAGADFGGDRAGAWRVPLPRATILPISSGSRISALPSPLPVIFGAGQPKFRSMKFKAGTPPVHAAARGKIYSGSRPNSCKRRDALSGQSRSQQPARRLVSDRRNNIQPLAESISLTAPRRARARGTAGAWPRRSRPPSAQARRARR